MKNRDARQFDEEEVETAGTVETRQASETFGARERPYDFRWGTAKQVLQNFGLREHAVKAAWKSGWIRARQPYWESDGRRAQTLYCFEDVHGYMERVAHRTTEVYADEFWTDSMVADCAEKLPRGPYAAARAKRGPFRKDGFRRLEAKPNLNDYPAFVVGR